MKTLSLLDAYDWDKTDRVVVLSPHLDDAVLSCAGLLRQLQGKVSRLVITLCCGNPVTRDAFSQSSLGQGASAQGGRPRKGFVNPALRRREDIRAMRALDVDFVHLGFLDAVDRRSPTTGDHIHRSPREKWFRPSVEDAGHIEELFFILRRLCTGMGRMLVISPLGIGNHIDHLITAQVALRLPSQARLLFYEDFPYVISRRLGEGGGDPLAAIRDLGQEPAARLAVPIDAADKTRLIQEYASQVPLLFEDGLDIQSAVAHRAYKGDPVEIYWKTRPIGSPAEAPGRD